jgi:hypothetical protein
MAATTYRAVANWVTGLVDEDFVGRTDLEELRGALRKCNNWVANQSGGMRVRPPFLRTGATWFDWGTDFIKTFEIDDVDADAAGNVFIGIIRDTGVGSLPIFRNYRVEVLELATGILSFIGNIDSLASIVNLDSTITTEQFGGSVFIAGNGINPHRLINQGSGSFLLERITFFQELPGLFTSGAVIEFDQFAQLSPTDTLQPMAVGDLLSFQQPGGGAVVATAEVVAITAEQAAQGTIVVAPSGPDNHKVYVKLVDGTIPISVAPLDIDITATGSAAVYSATIDSVTLAFVTSEAIPSNTVSVSDDVRILGNTYEVDYVDERGLSVIGWTSDDVTNVRISEEVGGSDPTYFSRAVTVYQSRIVFGGSWDPSRATREPARLWMSALYDPFTIRPVIQLQGDPSGPIEVDLAVAADDSILWLAGGDTLFVGGSVREYAIENQGAIGAEAELLPRFIIIGASGSDITTPFSVFEGRALFAPKRGGTINMFEYSIQIEKYSGRNVAWGLPSYLPKPVDIVIRGPEQSDAMYRILLRNQDGSVMAASFNSLGSRPSWAQLTHSDEFEVLDVISASGQLYALIRRSADDFSTVVKWDFDTSDYASDLSVNCTGSGTAWTVPVLERPLFEGKHPAVGKIDGKDVSVGYVDISAAGEITTPIAVTALRVFKQYPAVMSPLAITTEDEKGLSTHRKMRVVDVSTRVRNTRQLICNNERLLRDARLVIENELPEHTGVRQTFAGQGWTTDPVVEWTAAIPYNAIIDSATLKVVV